MTDRDIAILFARSGLPKRKPDERRFAEKRRAVDPGLEEDAEIVDTPKEGQYLPVLYKGGQK